MGPIEQRYHEEVERRAAEKLKNAAFIAEALSEIADLELRTYGGLILTGKDCDSVIGYAIRRHLTEYATEQAKLDMKFADFDAQREFEEELRDNEMDARREERAEMMATRKPE